MTISKTKSYLTFKRHNTISLQQYNQLMNSMLNQRKAFAKLRAELEEKDRRKC